ncbi:MAG: outer membrane protein assembly factor BamD [Silvanigrellaceae bacterium]
MTLKTIKPTLLSAIAGLSIASATVIIVGCELKPITELTADEGIARLRGLHKDESWERLVQEVNEYRSRFPYSQYASEAELLQADAFFKTNRFAECIANYDDFLRRNPSHTQADFALFRVGKSYDLQSPDDVDREQATAQKAIEKYSELLQKFPRSVHAKDSAERISQLKMRLAQHHLFVAEFYWKKELWHGALTRFLYVADTFSSFKDIQTAALSKASDAYLKLAEQLEKNPKSDELSFYRSTTPQQLKEKSSKLLERRKALLGGSTLESPKNEG